MDKKESMKEDLITFETAKLAKEKGFKLDVWFTGIDTAVNLPTQSLLQKWLREIHGIHVESRYEVVGRNNWQYVFHILDGRSIHIDQMNNIDYSESYEKALEKGLCEALKFIQ